MHVKIKPLRRKIHVNCSIFFFVFFFMTNSYSVHHKHMTINSHCLAKRFLFSCGYCSASHKSSLAIFNLIYRHEVNGLLILHFSARLISIQALSMKPIKEDAKKSCGIGK